jgi:predicted dithiol-disulfide oxidoreductase (DUF899 family)
MTAQRTRIRQEWLAARIELLEDGAIYHIYSAHSRGVDSRSGMYQWFDRAPKGRNETGPCLHRHDEYGHG